jgi:cytochrome c oxidase assembly protein subunit 15
MNLEEFKKIFYMEWGHREFGRFIGMVYALGLLWFGVRHKRLGGKQGAMLMGLLGLGGLQGAAGWFMVKSGLNPKGESSSFI